MYWHEKILEFLQNSLKGVIKEANEEVLSKDANGNVVVSITSGAIVSDNGNENPFGTSNGQIVTSPAESFWARLEREGRNKSINTLNAGVSCSAGLLTTVITLNPSIGKVFYAKHISFYASTASLIKITATSGIADDTSKVIWSGTTTSKCSEQIYIEDLVIHEGGSIVLQGNGIGGAATINASINGFERTE